MNSSTVISYALATLLLPVFATKAEAPPTAGALLTIEAPPTQSANDRESALGALIDSMVDCPSSLLADRAMMAERQQSIAAIDVDGESIEIVVLSVPESNSSCAAMTSPGLKPLSPDDYAALTNRGPSGRFVALPPLASPGYEKALPKNPQFCSSNIGAMATVYAGRCGTSSTPIASAYFATPYLALTAGAYIPANSDVCVSYFTGFYDVRAINRSSGSGDRQLAGLSLVRPAPFSYGFRVLSGPLNNGQGAEYGLQVDGVPTYSGNNFVVEQRCQSGPATFYDTEFARFYGALGTTGGGAPEVIRPGGAGWEKAAPTQPIGLHVNNLQITQSPYVTINPVMRRNLASDFPQYTQWTVSAVPEAGKSVRITNPTDYQLIDSAYSMYVGVDSGANYALLLNGWPVSNPLTGLANGLYDLVAYNVAEPQYRHLVRFEARRITGYADAFEPDDTRETYKPLYAGQLQQHSFHTSMNRDWTAFAVVGRTRSTVTLTGSTAFRSSLRIYRHSNYPNGTTELLMTRSNTANQLTVTGDSNVDGVTVFYVEAVPTHVENYGPTQNYTLALSVAQLPDGYEYDDERSAYKAIYGGSPQLHGFHHVNDQDWVAYAVTAGVSSRLELTGSVAPASRIEMYRHINYPDGAVELVDVSAAAGTLSVQHTAPAGEPFSVYYIRAAPNAGNAAATNAGYTLNVTTW